jgi:Flp pilus assembly protein TadG
MDTRLRSARGAVLIHVSIALIGLLGFSALSIDYGVMWVARRQAQNAADAAALAGAISLAFVNRTDQARARQAAKAAGEANQVWRQAPVIDANADITIGACPTGLTNTLDLCVRANVFRNQAKNPLPTFFATLLGIGSQGVRATATARVLVGNAVTCMRPWAIPDKWWDARDVTPPIEATPTWTWTDKYERYVESGPNKGQLLPNPVDCYHAGLLNFSGPYQNNCAANIGSTSFNEVADRGTVVTLKNGTPSQTLTAGWFFPIDLPRPGSPDTGGDRYRENIGSCNSGTVGLGDTLWTENGNMVGPTQQGMSDLIALDPNATWNGTDVVGGLYGTNNSPRIVPIPVFNVEAYTQQDKTTGKFQLQVTNILGFFVLPMQGNNVRGVLMTYPGDFKAGSGNVDETAAFLYTVVLVR